MSRTMLTALAVTAAALLAVGTPAVADTIVVGYTTVDTEYRPVDGEDPAATVRVQGLVVDGLEPRSRDAGTSAACPEEGCRYALAVVDPAAIRNDAAGFTGAGVDCNTLDHGIVDPNPEERDVGGAARVYAGTGSIPEYTVDTAGDPGEQIAPGMGLLCFANRAHHDGLHNDAGRGPVVSTQPAPIVIVYDRA